METMGPEPTTPCLQNRIGVDFAVLLDRNACWLMLARSTQTCWSGGVHPHKIAPLEGILSRRAMVWECQLEVAPPCWLEVAPPQEALQ